MFREADRRKQLKEIVTRHLTGLFEKYRFVETAKKSERLSRDLVLLCYEELKSELFQLNFPLRDGEILSLFDEFFHGSYRDFYREMIELDLELYFLALPEEAESTAPQGGLEGIVEEATAPMRKVYRDLMRQPNQFVAMMEKTFSTLLAKLETGAVIHPPAPEELLKLFRGKFPGVEEVYFKPLGKYRDRMASLPKEAIKPPEPIVKAPPEPEVPAPPRAEPLAPPPPEAGPPEPAPGHPQPAALFRSLVEKRALPPSEYYTFLKSQLAALEKTFEAEKDYFHQLIFSLCKASQKFREKLELHQAQEMDGEMINAGYLNAALSIAFAKSAEGGMRGQDIRISIE